MKATLKTILACMISLALLAATVTMVGCKEEETPAAPAEVDIDVLDITIENDDDEDDYEDDGHDHEHYEGDGHDHGSPFDGADLNEVVEQFLVEFEAIVDSLVIANEDLEGNPEDAEAFEQYLIALQQLMELGALGAELDAALSEDPALKESFEVELKRIAEKLPEVFQEDEFEEGYEDSTELEDDDTPPAESE